MNERIRADKAYQTFRDSPSHESATEAFMMFAADVLMCGSDVAKIQTNVANALLLLVGREAVRDRANKEQVLEAFSFLRGEGDAA